MIDVKTTLKALLEEADLYREKLENSERELADEMSLLGVKLDDLNAIVMDLEGRYDSVRCTTNAIQDHASRLCDTLESIGYHAERTRV